MPSPDLRGRWRQMTAPLEGTEIDFDIMDELLVATVAVPPTAPSQVAWEHTHNPDYQKARASAAARCAVETWAKGVHKFASVRRAGQRIWTGLEVEKSYFDPGFFGDQCAKPNPVGLNVELVLIDASTFMVRDPVRGERSKWTRVP